MSISAAPMPGRIAILLATLDIGGAERAMCTLAGALVSDGWVVDILVLGTGDDPMKVAPGVNVVELGGTRVVAAGRALDRYVRTVRPDALITNFVGGNALALALRRLRRWPIRIVAVEHTTVSEFARSSAHRRHRLLPFAVRLTYPWADSLVAVSAGVAHDLRLMAGSQSLNLEIVTNPLAFDEMLSVAVTGPADWPAPHGRPVFLAVGRLVPEKDFAMLLHAFALLRRTRMAQLVIVGEGEERGKLETLARDLGVAADVRLVGSRQDPFPYMRRASALVLSSRVEGAPTVLAEALVLGCRVVATDCISGPREILDDGRLGRLVPYGDTDAFALAMQAVLDDPPPVLEGLALEALTPAAAARRYAGLLFPPGHAAVPAAA